MISNKASLPGKFIVLASIIILMTAGCGNKKQIKGKEFIPREDMVELMLDFHLLDGITNDVKYYRKYNPGDSIDLYGLIFEEHGYERTMFDSTMKEYAKYPTLLDELYDEVLMKLNQKLDSLNQELQINVDHKTK